jgi:NitT/TauT family transport system permease protein/taurine transport system permease protein
VKEADSAAVLKAPAQAARGATQRRFTLPALTLLIVLLLIWQVVCGWYLPRVDKQYAVLLPPPSEVLKAGWELLLSGELLLHLGASLRRELIAFSYALVAIPLGIAMGWWRRVHDMVDPVVELLRPIPPIAWIPLSILWFGVGDLQNQFIIFLGIFFPILVNTIIGVKNIDPNLIRAARCLGANEWRMLRRVVLPAVLPQLMTGIRVGFGVGWMALVAAELVGATTGLGFLINDARSLLRTDIIILGMLVIGLAGFAIDLLIRRLSKWLLPWSVGAQK